MILRKFGVELRSLVEEDLPLVLEWRNDPGINRYMLFQEHITMEEHRRWFTSLGTGSVYLMIRWNDQNIGVFNLREIDWELRSAEAGIFIGDAAYRKSYVPMLCILAMMDLVFDVFGFSELKARVRRDNAEALQMNRDLGYSACGEDESAIYLKVTPEDYHRRRERFTPFLDKYRNDVEEIYLSPGEEALFLPVK